MEQIFFCVLAILSPIVTVSITLATFRRSQKINDDKAGREMGTILTEIGYVKSQIDSISRKLEHHEVRYSKLGERISAVEQSTKSAHQRIDNLLAGVEK